ncbi:MAG TPA: hypothetical protein VE463_04575 [Blastococcus sp.]|nr:hypothetical protein [Blastococcus sp.]
MTVDAHEARTDGRAAETSWGADPPRAQAFVSPRATGWTPAHSEVARFIGECFAVGAVLGFATELARPLWDQRRG